MNPCPTREQLQQLLAEELPPSERSPVEAHVEQCRHCQQTLERLVEDPQLLPSAPVDPSAYTPLLRLRRPQAEGAEPKPRDLGGMADLAADRPPLAFLMPATRPDSLGRLGHYEVLEVLGRGGFGIVFRAFDDVLQRVVAIKALVPELAATSPARKRFLREARAAAQVRHENVVQIHAVEEQPLPYLVMEFIPGETLQQRRDRVGPLAAAEVVAVGRQMAEGLAAAHAAGLIHRDVKPANVLVEAGPKLRVKITDFGLARAADDASLTQSGVVAGTPLYMSPEQARGEKLDHRTDLFSLGSVLYAITSGRPPFRAENTLAVLKRVTEDTPRPIQEVIPETPVWLCGVIARLHAKNPDERFQTATEVGEALAAGRDHQLQVAPRPRARSAGRWRLALAAASLVLALGVVIWGVSLLPWPWGEKPTITGMQQADRNTENQPRPRPQPPLTPEQLAALPSAADHLDRQKISPALLALAGGGNPDHAPPELVAVLGAQPFQHSKTVYAVCFSPNGRWLATTEDVGHDAKLSPVRTGEIRIWDAETGETLFSLRQTGDPSGVAFSPDGKHLATGSYDNKVRIWDLEKRAVVRTLKGTFSLRSVAFNADGDRLVTASHDKTARIWDVASGDELVVFKEHTEQVNDAIFSPDGSLVASAGNEGTVRLWESATGTQLKVLRGHSRPYVSRLSFRKDGKRLVSIANQDDNAVVWNVDAGAKELILNSKDVLAAWVAWSPDGTCIARCGTFGGNSGKNEPVRLYHPETGKEIGRLDGHQGAIWNLAFSADGKRLAGGGVDKRVHLWDITTRKKLVVGPGHAGQVNAVAFRPDGKTLASAGSDRTICLWDLATGKRQRALTGHESGVTSVAFHKDGQLLASGSDDGTVRIWDLAADKTRTLTGHDKLGIRVAFSPDGKTLASAAGQLVKLWDPDTGKLRHDLPTRGGAGAPAFSADGKLVAVGCHGGTLHVWDAVTGWELGVPKHEKGPEIFNVAFHPREALLAVCSPEGDGTIRLWSQEPLREVQKLEGHTGLVRACLWRPDGQLLISAGWKDGTVRLWDVRNKTPRSKAIALGSAQILGIAVSPEGRYLATANADGMIYVLRLAKQGEVSQVP